MKPISMDLRQRIVAAYKRREGTQAALAERFSVSQSSVERYLRLDREKGAIEARPFPGGTTRALVKESDRERLLAWLEENPDLTHTELAERLAALQGRSIGRSTMGAALIRLGITRKKSPSKPVNGKMKRS